MRQQEQIAQGITRMVIWASEMGIASKENKGLRCKRLGRLILRTRIRVLAIIYAEDPETFRRWSARIVADYDQKEADFTDWCDRRGISARDPRI